MAASIVLKACPDNQHHKNLNLIDNASGLLGSLHGFLVMVSLTSVLYLFSRYSLYTVIKNYIYRSYYLRFMGDLPQKTPADLIQAAFSRSGRQ